MVHNHFEFFSSACDQLRMACLYVRGRIGCSFQPSQHQFQVVFSEDSSHCLAGHKRVPPEAIEAAVAAAGQQAERALADCNARWMERANAHETETQQAQRRILELEAAAGPQVRFEIL